ncbi:MULTISPECIES: protein kinase family protein [unclassified Streptomyces]|uniref:protein kinase family protein n=1 Tax=unclassified Streptomyces TaxID=2593676 RepID=UPI00364FF701
MPDSRFRGDRSSRSHGVRLATYSAVSVALAEYGDDELNALVRGAAPLGSGIGGRSALLDVDGTQVFVKRVPLTAADTLPENVRSTANVYGLPAICHYGIGGPGFGAWQELAVHEMTTNWVLANDFQGFPLTYHWRVLPDYASDTDGSGDGNTLGTAGTVDAPALPEELADVDRVVAFWDGSQEVRHRLEGLREASASLTLFLEYVPQTLHQWLDERIREGGESADRACSWVDEALHAGTSFMNSHGLIHFDAHFENILTDGRRLYFADYGLALSSGFGLSPEHTRFFERHRTYDRCYTITYLVKWLITAVYEYGRDDREEMIRACARGAHPAELPDAAAEIVTRYAPLATVFADFSRTLQDESRRTPYPVEEIHRIGVDHRLFAS